MVKASEAMVLLVIFLILFFSQYHIYGFEGTSMCTDNSATDCEIAPGDIIFTRTIKKEEVAFNGMEQVLCTTDNVCHKLEFVKQEEFCTHGVNPISLHICYTYEELQALVVWVLPETFYRAAAFLLIGICLAKLFNNK